MRRPLLFLATLTLASAWPTLGGSRARAEEPSPWLADCVCGLEVGTIESVEPRWLMDRAEAGALETPDPHAVHVATRSEGSGSRAPILWCIHASDPRCAPLHASDAPPNHASLSLASLAVGVEAAPARSTARWLDGPAPPHDRLALRAPRSPDPRRLDRPPRG